ncbi:MAG: Fe-S biogenesis protein NfuA [Gemmatimonadota bacterium]|nr:MAG: Fe-S biogenesis protein NfuA [Gemmatimonadota bacterium]
MLTFTERARAMVQTYIDASDGDLTALRVSLEGSPGKPEFALTLVDESEAAEHESRVAVDGLMVLVDEGQTSTLEGATIDFVEHINESGFEVRLQAATSTARPRLGSPTGPMADRIKQVLDEQINPAIASHGGFIELVEVDGTEVYLEMSGGCQGCAMSRMTLRQGVERMVRQAVPEITEIHDVTDHSSGENPYFEGPTM